MLKSLSWSAPALAQTVPCLDSSTACLTTLTDLAIQNSSEIDAIEQRLALMDQRIDYADSRRWTNYLTLDPLVLVQNVLGGGNVQRDLITIADLEIQAADLVRRREEVVEALAREVMALVLAYERSGRALALLATEYETQQLQQAVMESAYRTGQGETVTMLSVWQRTEAIVAQCHEQQTNRHQVFRELELLVGEGSAVLGQYQEPCQLYQILLMTQPVVSAE